MRELLVVEHIAVQRGFQVFARMDVMRLQHLLDPTVEALDHAIGLRVRRRAEAMLDAKLGAEPIELVLAGGAAPAQAEQAVGEFAAAIGLGGADAQRASAFQVA